MLTERPADGRGTARDRAFMRRALVLARRGWGRTAPNPMVGAVVVRDGEIVGEGWHAEYGAAHAEVAALDAAGNRARGSTVYVTLEPCAHTGKTPPCADALVRAGVSRVVCAMRDPNPVAAGGGMRLEAAGIEVAFGVEEAEALELNAAFLHALTSTRPFVTLKLATSIDGAIADSSGRSRWLTGGGDAALRAPAARWPRCDRGRRGNGARRRPIAHGSRWTSPGRAACAHRVRSSGAVALELVTRSHRQGPANRGCRRRCGIHASSLAR